MTQNSVLSQDWLGAQGAHLEPKLRAHCAQAARTASAGRRVMAVSPIVSQPVSRYNPAAKPPSCHDTPIRIATQSPNSQALAHAPLTLARGPAVSQGLSFVSWPKHAMSWALQQCPAALCHDTIHCIVTQMGSSPSSLCFFFSFFFLILAT